MWKVILPSPVGELHAFASDDGLRAVLWSAEDAKRAGLDDTVEQRPDHPVLNRLRTQLDGYFAGTRQDFELPLDPVGTEFQQLTWRALRAIPYGETRTYAMQAKAIGRPRAVRAVGAANGRNPLGIVVPCHRVVGSDGSLVGFAGGVELKRLLLEHEARAGRWGPDATMHRRVRLPRT